MTDQTIPPPDDTEFTNPDTDVEPTQKRSTAALLVDLAQAEYRLGMSEDEQPFAVSKSLPHIGMLLRGGRTGLRAELARRYFAGTGLVASQQSLADAANVLEGVAAMKEPTCMFLRTAEHEGRAYIDCGDVDGNVIEIVGGGWKITDSAPVVFTRTKLTGPVVRPERGGSLDELWTFLHIAEADRPVILAAMIQALIQVDAPHPVVGLIAEQGAAKSSATRTIVDLIDPSPVPLRQAPRDADSWVTAAAGSWVVALDNLSGIPAWLSDSLCRASTGDGNVKRALYSDAGLAVVKFRRCVVINGIDLGALRGDLGERMVLADLPRIPKARRRDEGELNFAWSKCRGAVFGALLDLAAEVHHRLPTIRLAEMPRMADFARVLAAVDEVLGTDGMAHYLGRADRIAEDSLSADGFIEHLRAEHFTAEGMTSAEILAALTPDDKDWRRPRDWPKSSRAVTTLITRHAPALRAVGWTVDSDARNKDKVARWTITRPEIARISDPPDPPNPPTTFDQRKQGQKVAGQMKTTNPPNPPTNPPAGQGGLAAGQGKPTNPPTFDHITAGQDRSAGQAGQAGQENGPSQDAKVCRYCSDALVFDDDRRDGFHTSDSRCVSAHQKGSAA